MPLNTIGSQLVLQGLNTYIAGLNQAKAALTGFGTNALNAGVNVANAGKNIQGFGNRLTDMGNFLQRTGFILSFQLTAPLVALGKAVTGASIDFEDSFANVRRTVEETATTSFPKLSKAIRQLALEIPVPVNELNRIASSAGQVGIAADDIVPFVDIVAKLSVATNLGADSSENLARIANIMGTRDFPALGATINELGNKFAATEQEIVNMSLRLAGAGKTIGLTTAEVLSVATALSSVGVRAEAGGSAFSRVFITIAKAVQDGKDDLTNFAKVSGVTARQFAQQFKTAPAEAVTAFVAGLTRIQQGGGQLFTTLDKLGLNEIRVRDALLRAASAEGLFANSLVVGNKAYAERTSLDVEFAKKAADTKNQLQLLQNKLYDTAISVGDIFTPALLQSAKDFTDFIIGLADAFRSLTRDQQDFIVKIGLGVAALAPFAIALGAVFSLLGLIIQFVGILGGAGGLLVALSGKLIAATAASNGFAFSLRALAGSALAANIAIFGLIGVGVSFATNFMGIKDTVIRLAGLMAAGFVQMVAKISATFFDLAANLNQTLADMQRNILRFISTLGPVGGIAAGFLSQVTTDFQKAANDARETAGSLRNQGDEKVKGILDLANSLLEGPAIPNDRVADTTKDLIDNVTSSLKSLLNQVKDTIPGFDDLGDAVESTGKKAKETGEAFVQLSRDQLKAVITQTILASAAFDTWQKSMKDLIKANPGNFDILAFVADQFQALGKSANDAVKSTIDLYEELKKIPKVTYKTITLDTTKPQWTQPGSVNKASTRGLASTAGLAGYQAQKPGQASGPTFNVTANYQNPQEPQGVLLDLQALAMQMAG